MKNNFDKGSIVIYKTKNKQIQLEVKLEKETVWLTQKQIAVLFGTQRPAITKHLNNVFKSKELEENSVCSILEHTAEDGKTYSTQFYNLDAIISIGYRVNSQRATQFRIWATKILKDHIIGGYTVNEKRLLKQSEQLKELQGTIAFLQSKARHKLLESKTQEILNLLSDYAKSISILEQYDTHKLTLIKGKIPAFVLEYENCQNIIFQIKRELVDKKQASELFGQEVNKNFESIVKNLYQTFGGKELYGSIEEKAAHLLYLTIKDHPFTDGNKRIASFLFVYFLDKNNYLYKSSGEKKINDNALAVLALLIAESNPKEKEVMVKIITNLLSG
ncbi:MAG: virulence protein RhuM/Fic/DOC family protein [Elusimicrobiota bacterium]